MCTCRKRNQEEKALLISIFKVHTLCTISPVLYVPYPVQHTLRLPFVVKARPQMEQAKGFSPVCVRSWICRALAEEKFFPHALQLCCLGVRRGGGLPNNEVMPGIIASHGVGED